MAAGNTTFEELTCVGYHPTSKRLGATVNVKEGAGYSGGICTAGSQEYVHFQDLLASPETLTEKLATPEFEVFPGVEKIDISKLIKFLLDPQGNESLAADHSSRPSDGWTSVRSTTSRASPKDSLRGAGSTRTTARSGGQVWFSGHIFNRSAVAFGGPGIYYRIWISVDGAAWTFMNTSFNVVTHHYLSGTTIEVPQSPQNLGAPWGDGWYPSSPASA